MTKHMKSALNTWDVDDSIKDKLLEWYKKEMIIQINQLLKYMIILKRIFGYIIFKYQIYSWKNWIDFESEISNVIQAFECIRDNIERRERIQQGEGSKVIKLEVVQNFVNISKT